MTLYINLINSEPNINTLFIKENGLNTNAKPEDFEQVELISSGEFDEMIACNNNEKPRKFIGLWKT
jgi:hypothetical protein